MKNFAYCAAADVHDAIDLLSRTANAKFLAGGTNLVDLMREDIEQPDTLVDVTRLPARRYRGARRRRPVDRRGRQEHRAGEPSRSSASAIRCWRRRSCRRLRPDPQHGDGRRQPDAADALLLLLRQAARCNKREPGSRLRRARRLQPDARDPRRVASLHRDPSVRHVRRAGRARRDGPRRRARRRARDSVRRTSIACPATRRTSRRSCGPAS